MLRANRDLIHKYMTGDLDKTREAVPIPEKAHGKPALAQDQQSIVKDLTNMTKSIMEAKQKRETAWCEQGAINEEPNPYAGTNERTMRQAYAVLGPAGSGKTTAVQAAIDAAELLGARILITAPTGRQSTTLKAKYPHLDVDTVHGAFLLYKEEHERQEVMWPYDLVIVEEVGQLTASTFDKIMALWDYAERLVCLVFVGDFHQLPCPTNEERCARYSPQWHSHMLVKRHLNVMHRCKDPVLGKKLELLRTATPTKMQLCEILRNHRAVHRWFDLWEEPNHRDIQGILKNTPETLFLTVSRKGCSHINNLAVEVLFWDHAILACLPSDPESNRANYVGSRMVTHEPLHINIYAGMKVILTKNINKAIGFVNGMGAEVQYVERDLVYIKTDQGTIIPLHPWQSPERHVYYPFRLGYATTLHKIQGATLKHITLWLDVPNMKAAAYVALSRVEYDRNWQILGKVTKFHFTPAEG